MKERIMHELVRMCIPEVPLSMTRVFTKQKPRHRSTTVLTIGKLTRYRMEQKSHKTKPDDAASELVVTESKLSSPRICEEL